MIGLKETLDKDSHLNPRKQDKKDIKKDIN